MPQIRIQQGAACEIWTETDSAQFNGGSGLKTITTAIRANSSDLDHTRVRLYLNSIIGVPVVATPSVALTASPPVLQITFQNAAAPGNMAAWKLEVERIWSAAR